MRLARSHYQQAVVLQRIDRALNKILCVARNKIEQLAAIVYVKVKAVTVRLLVNCVTDIDARSLLGSP